MKLILVLSLVACGYAAKLDRTYLPPTNAATAGGSPGAISAPGTTNGFGQGLPNIPSGPSNLGTSSFGQNTNMPSGPSNFGTSSFGQNTGPKVPPGTGNIQGPGRGQASEIIPGSGSLGFNSNAAPLENEIQDTDVPSRPSIGQGFNNFGSTPQSKTPLGQSGQSSGQAFAQPENRPERPQAAADRNAEILKYVNENNGDSYEYSYETSNGISAEESGVATNGVRAQGGFSYTGDDGNTYSVTYTADENGFLPQGEHLPTPHPIPEEILKSIEENARAAAAGTQEGAYRPEEYESDLSPTPYGNGAPNNSPSQRPVTYLQGQGSSPFNQGQIPQGPQGYFNGNTFNQQTEQAPGAFSGPKTQKGPVNQYTQGIGSNNKDSYPEPSSQLKQSQQSLPGSNKQFVAPQGQSNQNAQSQNGNGYNYNKPLSQGARGPQQGQSPKSQGFGSQNNGLTGLQAGQPTGQFNQQSRPLQGSNNQFDNQRGSPNKYTSEQNQNGNGYNYNTPQTQDSNQFSGQRNQQQSQNSFPASGTDKSSSGQSSGPSTTQFNQQQRPVQSSKNQFGNQQEPNQYPQRQNDQGNGYNYNQPQNQGSRFPGSGNQQSTKYNDVFKQQSGQPAREFNQPKRPLQGSSNVFGKQQEPSKQFSQGQRGQEQRGNGYNYDQPQNRPQGSSQLSGFGNQAGQPTQPGREVIGNNNIASPSRAGQFINQFDQSPLQGVPSPGSRNQQSQSNQFSPKQNGQDQDENGYYYNRPQNGVSSPTRQGLFSQNRPQSNVQGQSVSPFRPASSYDSNNAAESRPGQQGYSNTMQPSLAQARPGSTNSNANVQPGGPAGVSQYSPETKPSFGSPSIDSRPTNGVNAAGSRPNERYQPSLSPASQFSPQQTSGQNIPTIGSFGSPRPSQGPSSQTSAQGYQYSSPDQSSNQSQRPRFNGNQFNGAPGANKGTTPAGSEFGGPRQPPSFSPEEGYKY